MFDLLSNVDFSSDTLTTLNDFLILVKHLMSLFGSLVILTGSIFVVSQFTYRIVHSRHHQLLNFDLARLGLTRSIVLGLEFIIAADVIQTTTAPTYYDVGILASLALIRSFLNYFLNKDLTTLSQREEQEKKQNLDATQF
jgi:uncharacterized membrane protein